MKVIKDIKIQNKIQNPFIYQAKNGAIELKHDQNKDSVWATQAQIAEVFDVERSVITKHIRNILKDGELIQDSVCANFAHTASDGKTYVVQHYNLDIILSVGYRTNSSIAIKFRQWATKTLHAHIVDGYTINRNRVAQNYETFMLAVSEVKALLPKESVAMGTDDTLELISCFAHTWMSLDAYDKDTLDLKKPNKKKVTFTADKLSESIHMLKAELIKKEAATEHFAIERQRGSLEGIVGNVLQSFGGKHVYESIEEKAAHLLYFIVKNHPFIDGNKRSGAYAFVWFLSKAKSLNKNLITPPALTAITLLVAESNPKDKERVVKLLIMLLLSK